MSSRLAIASAYFAARRPRKMYYPAITGEVCDAETMAASFEKYNALGLTLADARAAARQELETGHNGYPGYSFGLSTGTMGEPGVFLTTQSERDRWLGTILGKFLSLGQVLQLRAALLLRHNNRLYAASNRVTYFDLAQPVNLWAPRLCDLAPNVLIGPPSVLQRLGESGAFQQRPFQPHTLLCGAEPLFPQDREALERLFGVRARSVYQAREGFLAAGCPEGALHWNEDLMVLEGMAFKGHPERVVPVITDFTRRSQTFHRFRVDDVLLLDARTCGCRTPFQKVATVEGRLQDVILLPEAGDRFRPLFPLDLNAILSPLDDYSLRQMAPDHFVLESYATPGAELMTALYAALGRPERMELVPLRGGPPGQKRRRFQRMFDPQNRIITGQLLEPLGPIGGR